MEGAGVKGFFRVGISRNGVVEGITEWIPNVITLAGFRDFIVGSVGSSVSAATGRQVSHMAFGGTMASPASTDTALSSELTRLAAGNSYLSAAGGATLQATAMWDTGASATGNVGGVALHGTSSGGSAACLATFASSAKASDQTLTITYQLRFASA